MQKETYFHIQKEACPHAPQFYWSVVLQRPIHMQKETCSYKERDLFTNAYRPVVLKRHVHVHKETCSRT